MHLHNLYKNFTEKINKNTDRNCTDILLLRKFFMPKFQSIVYFVIASITLY